VLFLTSEEEQLRVFENRVLRIFELYTKVVEGWKNLHNEKLHNLYSSQSIIRMIKSRMGWVGHVALMGARNAHRILVGKPEGNKTTRKNET
jgi:hypothetical protein